MPCPPPGATVPLGSGIVFLVDVVPVVEVAAAGLGDDFENQECLAGVAVAAGDALIAALAAGEASFLACLCLAGLAEASAFAAGDSVVAAAGEGSFFLCLDLAGLGDSWAAGLGDVSCASSVEPANPVSAMITARCLVMS